MNLRKSKILTKKLKMNTVGEQMPASQRVLLMIAFAAFQKLQANKLIDKLNPLPPTQEQISSENVSEVQNDLESQEIQDVSDFKSSS